MKKILFTASFTFIIIQSVICQLTSSHLPVFIIDTHGETIADEPKITANLKVIFHGDGITNNISDTIYHYNNDIGIELRGNSSQYYPQKQYGIETRDNTTGDDLKVTLLNMPEESDWVLYAPYNDISMLRNVVIYDLWNKMGHWGPRTKFCELILNGSYQGIYLLTETIKRDKNRLDIAKLTETDTSGRNLTGGYIMKIDKKNNDNDLSFTSSVLATNNSSNITWLYHYPKPDNILPSQREYIHKYIDTVETVIQSTNFANPVLGYSNYIDVQSFIDYFIITEFSNNVDGYKASAYFYKEKDAGDGTKGLLKAGSVWDYNFALGNASFCNGGRYNAWVYRNCSPPTLPIPKIWARLLEDPYYANAVKCRYLELRDSYLSTSYINSLIDTYANDTIADAKSRHFNKWQILGTNPGYFNAYIVNSYAEEMTKLKSWISNRLIWMDNNLGGTCLSANSSSCADIENIKIYPNPANDNIRLKSKMEIYFVEIYNTLGQRVMTINYNEQNYVIDIASLPAGLYFISIHTDKRLYNRIFEKY